MNKQQIQEMILDLIKENDYHTAMAKDYCILTAEEPEYVKENLNSLTEIVERHLNQKVKKKATDKPTKRQLAIKELILNIDCDGLDYTLSHRSCTSILDTISDKDLINLIKKYGNVKEQLERKLIVLRKEITKYLADDSYF